MGLYQDYSKGGLRMTDLESMIKALKLAWIPRLLHTGHQNWKTVPEYFLRRYGGLELLLNCNYNVKLIENLPNFYRDILSFFSELKALYNSNSMRDTILFNNEEILIGGKMFFNKEWFANGIRSIKDLLDNDGHFLSFPNFQSKYRLTKTNFLQFYQVVNAIPKHLLKKAIDMELSPGSSGIELDLTSFCLEPSVELNLTKLKSKDFYWLLINRTYLDEQTGAKRWNTIIPMDTNSWRSNYNSVKTNCKENKLREFHFKFLHRILTTKKELYRFRIKADDNCVYCGEPDSTDHTFIHCHFSKHFIENIIHWFNETNHCNFTPGTKETLFGIHNSSNTLIKKLNYSLLFMRNYIYKQKLNEDPLLLPDFIKKFTLKYKIENR